MNSVKKPQCQPLQPEICLTLPESHGNCLGYLDFRFIPTLDGPQVGGFPQAEQAATVLVRPRSPPPAAETKKARGSPVVTRSPEVNLY